MENSRDSDPAGELFSILGSSRSAPEKSSERLRFARERNRMDGSRVGDKGELLNGVLIQVLPISHHCAISPLFRVGHRIFIAFIKTQFLPCMLVRAMLVYCPSPAHAPDACSTVLPNAYIESSDAMRKTTDRLANTIDKGGYAAMKLRTL